MSCQRPKRLLVAVALLGFLLSCGKGSTSRRRSILELDEPNIIFLGDSITQSGLFISYVEAYLLTQFPEKRFHLRNHGLNGDTVSGNRENGAAARRTQVLHRFTRDAVRWAPDQIVASFGMNDGCYAPFDQERFLNFQKGVHSLLKRSREEARAPSLVLMTPPPFDPYQRRVLDPHASDYGYTFPWIEYDQTLERYTEWLLTLHSRSISVADVRRTVSTYLQARRKGDVGFSVTEDGIHPNATGHWLIARTLLEAWNVPAPDVDLQLEPKRSGQPPSRADDDFELKNTEFEIRCRARLPWPVDPRWDSRSVEVDHGLESWNRQWLRVKGLTDTRYVLSAQYANEPDFKRIGEFAREELQKGIDLSRFPDFPTIHRAQDVLQSLLKMRAAEDARWRQQPNMPVPGIEAGIYTTQEDPERARLRELCKPADLIIRFHALPLSR